MVFGSVMVPQAAQAATDATIDNVSFKSDTFAGGSNQELTADWSVPDNPETPLTVTVPLPDELRGNADRFPATDPDGEAMGQCEVQETQVVCTIDDDYIKDNPRNIHGSVSFNVDVQIFNDKEEEHVFHFGDYTTPPINIDPNPNVCTENCDFTKDWGWKGGWYDNLNDVIYWTVSVESPEGGIPGGHQVTVTDNLDTSIFELVGDPVVYEAGSVRRNVETRREEGVYHVKSDGVTVSNNGLTVDFESADGLPDNTPEQGDRGLTGSLYQVRYQVKVLDEGKAKDYSNTASSNIEGIQERDYSGEVTRHSGSGTVVGTNFGKFAVTKQLEGDAAFADAPEFTLKWTEYADAKDTKGTEHETTLKAGEQFISDELFKGTRVVLTEVTPTEPANVDWAKPKFVQTDAEGNPLPDAEPSETVEITFSKANGNLAQVSYFGLTNEATLQKAPFEAKKAIENPDGVDLSGISSYTLNYSYPASDTWAAGSGTLTLPADGSVATSDELPVGAEVTLTEATPEAVAGATWEEPKISPEKLVIGEDDDAVITVTNAISKDLGEFSIQKSLSGSGKDLVPAGTEFTVNWSHPAGPGYEAGQGTVKVRAGEDPVTVEGLPAGAEITLTEAAPDPVTGGTWLDPKFSQTTFTIVKDQLVKIDLDNPIDLQTGKFRVKKAVEGTGAELVAPETIFEVDYSYPAGTGFEAGSGKLTVKADGEWVESGPLPYGAEVTLAELDPVAVAGGTWQGHVFDPETFTVGGDTTIDATLTNTITRDVGGFSLAKSVTGDASHLVDPEATFTFAYTYPDGETFKGASGEVTVKADGTPATVTDIPVGAEVTLSEETPEAVAGGTWQPVTYDGPNPIVIAKDQTIALGATNEITLNSGGFEIVKKIEGDAAKLVPADTEFLVSYSYEAGEGYEAGKGIVTVLADGTPTKIDGLPYGAEVTLTEGEAPAVEGAKWTGHEFSASSLTVGDGTVVEIQLTNTIKGDTPPAPPSTDKPRTPGLANTGAGSPAPWVIGGLAVVVAGSLLVMAGKRRRR